MAENTFLAQQARVLFELRCAFLFDRIQHLGPTGLTLLCFDGTHVAWKSDSPVLHRKIASALFHYEETGSFVTRRVGLHVDALDVFNLLPDHKEVQWSVFFGRTGVVGYLSNCNRGDIAKALGTFLEMIVDPSAGGPTA